jgi:hypothetical protein
MRRTILSALAAAALVVVSLTPGSAAATAGAGTRHVPHPSPPVACHGCWRPALSTTWDWVLSVVPTPPFRHVQMLDVDAFDASAADVASMHAAGIKVVCYISAGTYEDWRPDIAKFPPRLLGGPNGWPGERWLDIRDAQARHSVLLDIMDARLHMCRVKGFDGVELDNVDGYANDTGLPLTFADQLYYDATLANHAHARGLMVLQKNDLEQIPALLPYFDAALNEECNQYHECTTAQNGTYGLDQYVAAGKAVFQAEYKLPPRRFCPADRANGFNGVQFDLDLDGRRFRPCG